MIPLPAFGLYAKLAVAGVLAIGALGLTAWVYSLKATIADQRTMITEVTSERDQEHRTAEHNGEMVRRMGALRAAEAESRKRLQAALEAERKKTLSRVQEIQRAPTANDPLPPAFDAFLRRVQ